MLQFIKNILKRFLPPPARSFNREIERILSALSGVESQLKSSEDAQKAQHMHLEQKLKEQSSRLADQAAQYEKQISSGQMKQDERLVRQQKVIEMLSGQVEQLERQYALVLEEMRETKRTAEQLQALAEKNGGLLSLVRNEMSSGNDALSKEFALEREQTNKLIQGVERVRLQAIDAGRHASEAVWGEIFNNAITGSTWLTNTAFSPGRWAVGYPVLYVMYRVLNETHPKRILELGLGQSTRMIAQYAAACEGVEHVVVEHDPEWIRFFENDFQLSDRSKIVQLDREMVPYKEAEAVRVFKGFREAFGGQKFDFISIDAPLGGDMKQYARIDVLQMLPDCLSDDFVIMIDDAERSGEGHTVAEMEECLKRSGIPYRRGCYSGKKDSVILCAEHLAFLATL